MHVKVLSVFCVGKVSRIFFYGFVIELIDFEEILKQENRENPIRSISSILIVISGEFCEIFPCKRIRFGYESGRIKALPKDQLKP